MHEFFLSPYIAIEFFIVALATEALIELIKESDISLNTIHYYIVPRYEENQDSLVWYTLYKWITCGQCMSVIYSIPGAVFLSYETRLFLFPVFVLALQRVSNWLNTSYKILYRGRVTAIELVAPVVEMTEEYDPQLMLSEARRRDFMRGDEQTVIIRTISDIQRIIKRLKETRPDGGRQMSVKIGQSNFHIDTSTKHPPYMDIIKDAMMLEEHVEAEPVIVNGEKIVPLGLSSGSNINGFIETCTGGKRSGNRIKWELHTGIYFYDPVTDKMTMIDRE